MNWRDYCEKHKGETCIIIGNGPSLKGVPREFLLKYPTFGTNRIYLLDGFTPTYYCAVNPLVIQQFIADIAEIDAPKFMPAVYCFDDTCLPLNSSGIVTFSQDASAWIYEGHTVTFVCMQIAYFMGFRTILLVGVDHMFTFDGTPNELRMMDGDDINHFHPDYFKGRPWNNPDLIRSEHAYKLARTAYEANGGRIINLTPNTGENVLEHGDISEW